MNYKNIVKEITFLPWNEAQPQDIAYTSLVTGEEFADSLRKAASVFPEDKNLQIMCSEEISTNNLKYNEYEETGDHVDMLKTFFEKLQLLATVTPVVIEAGKEYRKSIDKMSHQEKAMSVFSRENELPKIFSKILTAHDWNSYQMGFYRKYLEEHIKWDGTPGGHADLVSNFELDEDVLDNFYNVRLKFYKNLFI